MGWPTLHEFAVSDKVQLRRATVGQDASKGRKYTYPATWERKQYGVAVLPASAEEVDQFSREGQTVRYTVVAQAKLGGYRDQLLWVETGEVLTIVSILASGTASSRTWDHHCEVHGA